MKTHETLSAQLSPALWGGHECTVNRVGDQWFDQTVRSGHQDRVTDLDLFAGLGVRALRYPALWERISPQDPETFDWSWTDERLPRIRDLGMSPIVTLCHHGSGPKYTSLLDSGFSDGLARHASAVAERYPWITDWTPVNEPLTTARFSALYGYWYPHLTDESAFWVALLNEIDATRKAMSAIRRVNHRARLIQTDDLGFCHATPPLQAEADYQNERRWMGWDLLCGLVRPGHPLWDRLVACGLEERLRVIADDPCPPDIIGVNHYLSSERYLDHRVHLHAQRSLADRETGQLGHLTFVDVDAIRSRSEGVLGLKVLLRQAWERYGIPVAVTECHNGATRDEQARWFVDVWSLATELRAEGVDVQAVTAWSLLGSYDWNRMVTRFIGHYEPGVFDLRSGSPRPTLMAHVLRALAVGERPQTPVLSTPGWWRRSALVDGASAACPAQFEVSLSDAAARETEVLMIVGDDGPLVRLARLACEVRGLHHVVCQGVEQDLIQWAPWAVLDLVNFQEAHGGRREPTGLRTSALPALCDRLGIAYAKLADAAAPDPDLGLRALMLRCDPIYSPDEANAAAKRILDRLEAGDAVQARIDRRWRQAYGPDVLDATLDLLLDGATGVIELRAPESWSEYDFARTLCDVAGCDLQLVRPVGSSAKTMMANQPGYASHLPPGETTLERFVRESRLTARGAATIQRRGDETRLEAAE